MAERGGTRPQESWVMNSLVSARRTAVDVQYLCWEKAHNLFSGRDEETDVLLALWEDTIEKLYDPVNYIDELSRRLDWATKLIYLRYLQEGIGLQTEWSVRSFDLKISPFGFRPPAIVYLRR